MEKRANKMEAGTGKGSRLQARYAQGYYSGVRDSNQRSAWRSELHRRDSLSQVGCFEGGHRRIQQSRGGGAMILPIPFILWFHRIVFVLILIAVILNGAVEEGRRQMLVSYLTPQTLLSMSLQDLTEIRVM